MCGTREAQLRQDDVMRQMLVRVAKVGRYAIDVNKDVGNVFK